jgi:hypothetical protein
VSSRASTACFQLTPPDSLAIHFKLSSDRIIS